MSINIDARFKVESIDGKDAIVAYVPMSHANLCKDVAGGSWNRKVGAYVYPARPHVARALRDAFSGFNRRGNPAFVALLQTPDEQDAARAIRYTADVDLPAIPIVQTTPWAHQLKAYHFAYPLHGAMLAMDMGTGKSKVVIDLLVNRNHRRTLIVAPKSVVSSVWPFQLERHSPVPLEVCTLGDINGGSLSTVTKKMHLASIAADRAHRRGVPLVIIVNYESAWREPLAEWISTLHFDLAVFDESHRIKAPGGRASMFCARLAKKIPYRLALTGTPMPHSPLDIYAQMRTVDITVFGNSFTTFKNKYAIMDKQFPSKLLRMVNETEMNQKLYSVTFRVGKEVLDLPEVQHIERTCTLGAEAMKVYKQLDQEFIVEVEQGNITAQNVLVKLLRMQQITSGTVRLEDGEYMEIDTAKSDLFADILGDLPPREPVVVFCKFHHDLDAIRMITWANDRKYAELSGRDTRKQVGIFCSRGPEGAYYTKTYNLMDWQGGEADVIGVQIQSGGVGIDLTRARYGIYYSLGFSLGDYEQSLARIHRPGQQGNVIYYHLIAESTVDRKVYQALRDRKNAVEAILAEIAPAKAAEYTEDDDHA